MSKSRETNCTVFFCKKSGRARCDVSSDRFYKTLAMNMNNNHKSVYAAAAEVIGMTLTLLTAKETSTSDVERRRQYIDDIIKQLMDKKPDRFVTCLHCIQLHFPAISDRFSYNFLPIVV